MDDLDKKLDDDIKKIKAKFNEFELSEDFKKQLKEKMDYEYYKKPSKNSNLSKRKFVFRKLIPSFACLILVFSTCFAFADNIEDWIMYRFSNTDKIVKQAIADGNYKEINMDYITENEISIKADYLVKDKNYIYITLNLLTNIECDKILLDDIQILNDNNKIIYDLAKGIINPKINYNLISKKISKGNFMLIVKLNLKENTEIVKNSLKLKINKITFRNNNEVYREEFNKQLNINL